MAIDLTNFAKENGIKYVILIGIGTGSNTIATSGKTSGDSCISGLTQNVCLKNGFTNGLTKRKVMRNRIHSPGHLSIF